MPARGSPSSSANTVAASATSGLVSWPRSSSVLSGQCAPVGVRRATSAQGSAAGEMSLGASCCRHCASPAVALARPLHASTLFHFCPFCVLRWCCFGKLQFPLCSLPCCWRLAVLPTAGWQVLACPDDGRALGLHRSAADGGHRPAAAGHPASPPASGRCRPLSMPTCWCFCSLAVSSSRPPCARPIRNRVFRLLLLRPHRHPSAPTCARGHGGGGLMSMISEHRRHALCCLWCWR